MTMTIQIVLLSVFSLKCIKFIQEKTSCKYIILSHSWLANFESVPKWGKLNFGEEPKNTPPFDHGKDRSKGWQWHNYSRNLHCKCKLAHEMAIGVVAKEEPKKKPNLGMFMSSSS
jgi:hypothetical protein